VIEALGRPLPDAGVIWMTPEDQQSNNEEFAYR
jgi:hypothetical protein